MVQRSYAPPLVPRQRIMRQAISVSTLADFGVTAKAEATAPLAAGIAADLLMLLFAVTPYCQPARKRSRPCHRNGRVALSRALTVLSEPVDQATAGQLSKRTYL